jgi:hypothetical protein
MSLKWIHVNQHRIKANKKNGTNEPVITIKQGRTNTYCHEAFIDGPSMVVYSGNENTLLPCGARVAIKTYAPVTVLK